MTDREVIRALNCCTQNHCSVCPLHGAVDCEIKLPEEAVRLIETQREKIERLQENEIPPSVCDCHLPLGKEGKRIWVLKAAPKKTGEWNISCDGYYPYCSECGAEPQSGVMTNYCPECGVKMNKK